MSHCSVKVTNRATGHLLKRSFIKTVPPSFLQIVLFIVYWKSFLVAAHIIKAISLPLCSLHMSLSAQGQTMVSALVFSTLLWLSLILALRFCLKLLLSYHQWMFEKHGRMSNTTKVWVVSHVPARSHSFLQRLLCACVGLEELLH